MSLLSKVVINFKKDDKLIKILLEPRSLLIISGEARYEWSHGISWKNNEKKVDVWEGKEIPR